MKHEFFASRDKAQAISEQPFWNGVYQQAFPGLHDMVCHPSGEHWGQYAGIDRTITLASGTHILIDEKLRHQAFKDVLLEYWAVKEKRVPGWICLDLACDFVNYAILPLGICYMLPFPLLRRAWESKGEEWKRKYQIVTARNNGYTSESVAVPVKELLVALTEAMRITWNVDEERKAG